MDPFCASAREIVALGEAELRRRYPDANISSLDPAELVRDGGVLYLAFIDNRAAGCGALRPLADRAAEIKRMYVRDEYRKRGVARELLRALEAAARARGYAVVRLETGGRQPEAMALYESAGYHRIPCYGAHRDEPGARCFEKAIMITNRSVPANILLPHLVYRDVAEAIRWLARVYGFKEHYRYGDPAAPQGAQMRLGEAYIMLRTPREDSNTPAALKAWNQSLTIFVEDVEAHYAAAKAAGANIVEELNVTMYGERQYGTVDLDGHHWLFSAHARDADPAEWGATVTK